MDIEAALNSLILIEFNKNLNYLMKKNIYFTYIDLAKVF